jgi:hypothetical protein
VDSRLSRGGDQDVPLVPGTNVGICAGGWAMIAELADCANAGRLVVALLISPVILCSLLFGWTYEPAKVQQDR